MKTLKPIYFLVSVLVIVGLACSTSGGGTAGTAPTQPSQKEVAKPPATATTEPLAQPTAVPPTQAPPTAIPDTPTSAVQQFFTEEFDKDLGNWTHYTIDGNTSAITEEQFSNVSLKIGDGSYLFDIKRPGTWIYSMYEPFDYTDVRLDVTAINQGSNNNNVSLICRYSKETGWYEFNIANSGLYWIYYAQPNSSGRIDYNLLVNGGSTKIKQGKDTNQYAIVCRGKTLALYINGNLIKEISDNKYVLENGKIGISISSFNLPVKVKFESVTISQP